MITFPKVIAENEASFLDPILPSHPSISEHIFHLSPTWPLHKINYPQAEHNQITTHLHVMADNNRNNDSFAPLEDNDSSHVNEDSKDEVLEAVKSSHLMK